MPIPALYYWLRIPSSPESAETDQYRLMELGALGTEEEEGLPLKIRASFDDEESRNAAVAAFRHLPELEAGASPWEDWDRSWRERQTPVEVTAELTVCPPWVDAPAHAVHVIRLEAKMAFGTGSHESTRIATLLLEERDLRGKTLLDVGTGTGILALYAAQRGARLAAGFDIDPVAGPCLRENLDLNPLPSGNPATFYVGTLDALRPASRFDVLLCNMIRTEVWPYLDALLSRMPPGGALLVSGQRVEDQPYWRPWFTEKGVEVLSEKTLGEWWGFAVGF